MDHAGDSRLRLLRRHELYHLVWGRPMTRLALEFGVSGTALKKICARHLIPTPPRGYWAKLAAGRPAATSPLPKPNEDGQVRIFGADARLPPEVRAAGESVRERTRQALLAGLDLGGDAEVAPNATETAGSSGAAQGTPAAYDGTTPDVETPAHPALAATLGALAEASEGPDGLVGIDGPSVVGMRVAPSSGARALALVARLVRLCEAQGGGWQTTSLGLVLVLGAEPVRLIVKSPDLATPGAARAGDSSAWQSRGARDTGLWPAAASPW
jgi:hypothetical protein